MTEKERIHEEALVVLKEFNVPIGEMEENIKAACGLSNYIQMCVLTLNETEGKEAVELVDKGTKVFNS